MSHVAMGGSLARGGIACLLLGLMLALTGGTAHAAPGDDARKKLDALNEQFDQLDEQFNKTKVDLDSSSKRLTVAKQHADAEQTSYQQLRDQIVQMAASAYKTGNLDDLSTFLAAREPQHVLDQAAVFTELAKNRSSVISQFLQSAQRLQLAQGSAQQTHEDVAKKYATLKTQEADLKKKVDEQKKLLKTVGEPPKSVDRPSGGSTYKGPASGNARTALNFAYAQIGCAYHYGGVGPCGSGFDCSGLTMKAWAAAGVTLPRTTTAQYSAVRHVSKADRQPGDLVFFSGLGHTALYAGGDTMVEAPHTGLNVRTASVSARSNVIGYGRP